MGLINVSGPSPQQSQATANADAIQAGITERAFAAATQARQGNADPQKINTADQALNAAISSDGNTQATLNNLANQRLAAYTTLANTSRGDPNWLTAQRAATDAAHNYGNAVTLVQNNGGSLPNASASDDSIPTIEVRPDTNVGSQQPDPLILVPNYDDQGQLTGYIDPSDTPTNANSVDSSNPDIPDNVAGATGGSAQDVLAGLRGKNPDFPTANDPSGTFNPSSSDWSNDGSPDLASLGGSKNPATNTPIVKTPDQRVRLTPKNMSILNGGGGASGLGLDQVMSRLRQGINSTASGLGLDQVISRLRQGIGGGSSGSGSILSPLIATQGLMFPYTPTISYTTNVNYGTQTVVHANQDFRTYTNTPSVQFQISGTFTAQTDDEAKYLVACLHFLRSVTKMRFGQGSSIGLPPPMLILNGYGLAILNNLSVIVTNFSMDFPDNVDYIKTSVSTGEAWVPVFTKIIVTCIAQNTPNKLRTFNWDSFANGSLLSQGGWA